MSKNLRDDLQTLLRVQEVDSRVDKAKAAIAALDSGAQLVAQYNSCKAEAEKLRSSNTLAIARQKDAELKLASLEEKRQQVEMTMMKPGVAPRELENLQLELEMIERQRAAAEEVVLTAMDSCGDTDSLAVEFEDKMAAFAAEYRKVRAAYKQQHELISGELKVAESERVKAAEPVSPGLLKRYDTIRAKRSGIGVATIDTGDNCGACHTHLHSSLAQAVRAAEEAQTCEFCGRLLTVA